MGDSNASGEGNPLPDGSWVNIRCHRSDVSGHALAAARIEDDDPYSSVTYLSFACTGAKILEGIVLNYAGGQSFTDNENPAYSPRSTPQVRDAINHLCKIRFGVSLCL